MVGVHMLRPQPTAALPLHLASGTPAQGSTAFIFEQLQLTGTRPPSTIRTMGQVHSAQSHQGVHHHAIEWDLEFMHHVLSQPHSCLATSGLLVDLMGH